MEVSHPIGGPTSWRYFFIPSEMITILDYIKNYESKVFAELCQLQEIQKTRTSPGNPRCNGQAECFNRTLLKMIKAYLMGEQRNWDKHLGCLAAAYRGTRHESTGLSPNLMMLVRETRVLAEVMCGQHIQEANETYGEYVHKLKERLQHAHDVARNHLHDSAKRQKQIYNARVKANQYEVGDLVWMETDIGQLDITPKLRVPYKGPYMIRKQLDPLDYEGHMFWANPKIVHHNRLKPYHGLKRPPGYHQALAEAKRKWPSAAIGHCVMGVEGKTLCSKVGKYAGRGALPIESGSTGWTGGSPYCHWPQGHHAGWLYLPRLVGNVMGDSGLTILHCLNQMFQCTRCGVSPSRTEEVVQHFLREHLKPSEVPFMCNQCPFRAHTCRVMVDHRRGKHQAPQGEDLDQICYGTLRPIWEEEIFKLLPVLHRPEAENKKEKKSERGRRELESWLASYEERCSGHRGKRRSQEPCPCAPVQQGSPCQRGGSRTQWCHQRMWTGKQ